jgi:hypothetical protein
MIFFANVKYSKEYYMEDGKKQSSSFHTVDAETEDEARDKILKYYDEEKSISYSVYYMVNEIDFAIHIN